MRLRSTLILCTLLIPLAAGSVLFHATLRLFAQDKATDELPAATERPLTPAVELPKPVVPAPPAPQPPVTVGPADPASPIEPPKPVDLPETRRPIRPPADQPEVKITHFKYVLADQKALPLAQVLKKIYPRVEFLVDEQANAILVTNGTPQSHKRLEEFLTHSELSPDEKAKRGLPDNIREFLEGQAREMLAVNPPVSTRAGEAVSFVEVVPGRGPVTVPGAPGIPMPGTVAAPPGMPTVVMTASGGVAYLPQNVPVSPEQQRYIAKDRLAQQLATLLREKSQRSPEDVKAVKDAVQQAFDLRQEMLRREVQEFRERLDRLSKTLEEREQGKARIIGRRVDELLNPELGWSVETEPAGTSAATSYGIRKTEVGPAPVRSTRTAPAMSMPAVGMPGGGMPTPAASKLPSAPREKLDTMVIPLKHAKAAMLSITLSEVQGEDTFNVRMTADVATNTLVVFGTPADLKTLTGLIQQLDIPPVEGNDPASSGSSGFAGSAGRGGQSAKTQRPGMSRMPPGGQAGGGQPMKFDSETKKIVPDAAAIVSVFALRHAKAGEVAGPLEEFANEIKLFVRITVDPATNSLLVAATPEAMQIVTAFLRRMDVAPQAVKDEKDPEAQAENLKLWQGRWLIVNAFNGGKEVKDEFANRALTVVGQSVKVQSWQPGTEGSVEAEGTLKLTKVDGKAAFDIQTPTPLIGIYEFSDGKLVLGSYQVGSKKAGMRPENLDSKADSDLQLYMFDRVSDPDPKEAVAPSDKATPETPTVKR